MTSLPSSFLFIADIDEAGDDLAPITAAALKGGCRWVLLRGVRQSRAQLLAMGHQIKSLCSKYKASFSVSRDPAVAYALKADGLHMPATSRFRKIPGQLLGQSCHNLAEIKRAAAKGVDYVFLSPVFPPISKPDYGPALGLAKLKALSEQSPVPVYALGGITPKNAVLCLKAGAKGVAAMGGIIRSRDPQQEVRAYFQNVTLA